MPPAYLLLFILIALSHAGIALWVFSNKPADAQHQAFCIFEVGATLWILGDALILATRSFVFEFISLGAGITMLIGLVLLIGTLPTQGYPARDPGIPFCRSLAYIWSLPLDVFLRGMGFATDGNACGTDRPRLSGTRLHRGSILRLQWRAILAFFSPIPGISSTATPVCPRCCVNIHCGAVHC
jgi:hypothetical protein